MCFLIEVVFLNEKALDKKHIFGSLYKYLFLGGYYGTKRSEIIDD